MTMIYFRSETDCFITIRKLTNMEIYYPDIGTFEEFGNEGRNLVDYGIMHNNPSLGTEFIFLNNCIYSLDFGIDGFNFSSGQYLIEIYLGDTPSDTATFIKAFEVAWTGTKEIMPTASLLTSRLLEAFSCGRAHLVSTGVYKIYDLDDILVATVTLAETNDIRTVIFGENIS